MESNTPLRITLLGAPQVYRGHTCVDSFITNKALALFCYLVMTRRPHTRDALAGLFWAEMPNTDAKTNLRKALSNLRKLFPETFIVNRRTISFNVDYPHTLDVAEFSALIAQLDVNGNSEKNIAALEKAVSLYRGEFLAGFYLPDATAFSEWVLSWRERLGEQALQAMYTLAKTCAKNRRYEQAVHYFKRVLEIDPWREEAHRQLMLALTRMGRRSAALAQYHTCRNILSAELGVLPATETRLLYERIEATGGAAQAKLPQQPTPFIGRNAETATVTAILMQPVCRLLTITGHGGVGKTRLALKIAEQLKHHFFDGVFFVPMTAVQTGQSLIHAIGSAINMTFGEQGNPIEQLENHLQQREMLLVLDNFEHLVNIVPHLEKVLERTPGVKLLITSRVRLHSRWEYVFVLNGFSLDEKTDALPSVVQLFTQNARRIRHDFSLPKDDVQTVLEICRRLAGVPLGIELAARWVSSLTCRQILEKIRDDVRFLDAVQPSAQQHGGSLQAVLDYTWQQLTPTEQTGFARLGVFRGTFTAEATTAIADVSAQMLLSFIEYGMIARVMANSSAQENRYEMHQLWRQFAAEKLAAMPEEETRAQLSHRRYYGALLAAYVEQTPAHNAPAHPDDDFDNILLGWERVFSDGNPEAFETYTRHMALFLEAENRFDELKTLLRQALERAQAEPGIEKTQLAHWLRLAGEAYFRLGRLPKSLRFHKKALAVLGFSMPSSPPRRIFGLGKEIARQIAHRVWMGVRRPHDDPVAVALLEGAQAYERLGQILFFENAPTTTLLYTSIRGMNLAEKVAPSAVLSRLYGNMIIGGAIVPAHGMARFYRRLALDVARRINPPTALAWVLELSSIYRCGIGEWEGSAADAQQAFDIAVTLGDTRRQDECRVMPAHIAHQHGEFRRSAEIWLDLYASSHNRGDVQAQRWGLCGQAENFLPLGRVAETVSYIHAALDLPLKIADIGTDISCYGLLAEAYLKQQKYAAARQYAEIGLHLVSETSPAAFSSLGGYASLAHVYLRLRALHPHDKTLAAAAEKAEAILWKFSRVFSIGQPYALLYRGTLAWQRNRPKQAMRRWEKGIALARTMQMPYREAMIFAEMARCLPDEHPQKQPAAARAEKICAALNVPSPYFPRPSPPKKAVLPHRENT